MARIFLSHSSANHAQAIALRDWLISHGWDDLFLDLDPERGLRPGEHWQAALKQAAECCELVICLLSPEWAASKWCLSEFLLAENLNKRIFGVIVEATPLSDLPVEMTAEWQLVDLTAGKRNHKVTVKPPPCDKTETVTFFEEGLDRLRIGLVQAGVDARYFYWPPEDDPERAPYRGLEPLQADDAGIFFGRDGPTIVGLDLLRGLREAAPPRLFVILGASGAGKSSFLRAGLLPRLAQESQHFLPLPVIRPERAVLTGETGLIVSLEQALKEAGLASTRVDIRNAIKSGVQNVASLLRDLVKANAPPNADDGTKARKPPTLVLSIDQAEELFHGEGAEEARTFLDLLGTLAAEDNPALIVLFTIRSESYGLLQQARQLEGLRKVPFDLSSMPKGAYAEVIKGPAKRLEGTSRALKIEEALVDALLADVEEGGAKDALPLLAFTLERLYHEAGDNGDLKLCDYEELGRVKGSIEAAVERALKAADGDPKIPRDQRARLALLRRGLIPWLAGIDPDTGSPRRRVVRRSEIPEESVPLIDLLVEQRLLATDIAKDTGEVTIEPVHEALLRQWGLLQGWLNDDLAALTTLEGVKRAALDWAANDYAPDWLNHTGTRLEEAEQFSSRGDLAGDLSTDAQNYVKQCRQQEEAKERERLKHLKAEREEQERRVKDAEALAAANKRSAQRTGVGLLAALVLVALAGWQWWKAEQNMELALSERSAKEERQLQLAKSRLADAREPLDKFFAKAEMRMDTIWRLCSRPDGLVSRWLTKVKSNSTLMEQEKLVSQLNTIFVPLIDADPYVSSMMIVGPGGFEYVVLDERSSRVREKGFILRGKGTEPDEDRYNYTWRNRVMRFDDSRWAREWYWQDDAAQQLKGWNPKFKLELLATEIDGELREIAYDPRYRRYARPWLREEDQPRIGSELWAKGEPDIHWTPPYIFFTSKVPGVTASRGWTDANNNKYVVAIDFSLTELSTITTQLRLHQRGMVFMFDANGTVISLPHGLQKFGRKDASDEKLTEDIEQFFAGLLAKEPRGARPDEIPKALEISQVDVGLGTTVLEPAFEAWKAKAYNEYKSSRDDQIDVTVDFSVRGESWTGLFESVRYPRGDRSIRIAVIAPTKELGIERAALAPE
jgi:hypothetical protein